MSLQPDGYTFVLSDDVSRTPVRYRNRYGIEMAADLYRVKDFDGSATYPAIVVGPPHGGVKEQGPRRVRAGTGPPRFRRDRLRPVL